MRLKSVLPRRADRCCASFHSARSLVRPWRVGRRRQRVGERVAERRRGAGWRRPARDSRASRALTGAPVGVGFDVQRQRRRAPRPAPSVNAATAASGSIVSLRPGMYTVDSRVARDRDRARCRAGWRAPGRRCGCRSRRCRWRSSRTENASSISVVVASSIENARTSARGKSGDRGQRAPRRERDALRERLRTGSG